MHFVVGGLAWDKREITDGREEKNKNKTWDSYIGQVWPGPCLSCFSFHFFFWPTVVIPFHIPPPRRTTLTLYLLLFVLSYNRMDVYERRLTSQ